MPRDWTDEERLAALYLYFQTPFGKLHKGNREIIELAERMGRTPSSVAMKLTNFASLDPELQSRGTRGLPGASAGDRAIWTAFSSDWNRMVEQSTVAYDALILPGRAVEPEGRTTPTSDPTAPDGPTTVRRSVAVRRGQDWFRATLKAGFEGRCCVSGCDIDSMLVASHIVPWSEEESLRLNPRNGLLLSAIHDRAFEHGYLAISDENRVMVATSVRTSANAFLRQAVGSFHEAPLRMPERFPPDPVLLRRHRESRFRG
ncbi:MAG TPA: HNH endonuclease [Myxococcota bacterium]|nr:HNH endonuclease [Myxococcota bacterium]